MLYNTTMQLRTESITVTILLASTLILLGGLMSGTFSPAIIRGTETVPLTSTVSPSLPSTPVTPRETPVLLRDDSTERLKTDDNLGESTRRQRGKDHKDDR